MQGIIKNILLEFQGIVYRLKIISPLMEGLHNLFLLFVAVYQA